MPIILGPTGEFPEGKLNKDDEGALNIGITDKDGEIIIHFGTPIAWLAMDPTRARQFAAVIIARANEVKPEGL